MMAFDRDVAAFDRRAGRYETGRLGRWHLDVTSKAADLVAGQSIPGRVLDIGCGTGALLRDLQRLQPKAALVGLDPAPAMAAMAAEISPVVMGTVEDLPFPVASFDIVVSTMSFDHWRYQARGLAECARVLSPGGRLFLVDLFSAALWPTTIIGRRRHARTIRRATSLLQTAGFGHVSAQRLMPLVRIVTAVAP